MHFSNDESVRHKLQALEASLTLPKNQHGIHKGRIFCPFPISGRDFPVEYKEFMYSFGPGAMQIDELTIFDPFEDHSPKTNTCSFLNVMDAGGVMDVVEFRLQPVADVSMIQIVNSSFNRYCPFYPQKDGLIAWASFIGGYVCWLPVGHQDTWSTVFAFSSGGYMRFDMSFLNLMQALVLDSLDFGEIYEGGTPPFTGITEYQPAKLP
jgi:hypothetical protein